MVPGNSQSEVGKWEDQEVQAIDSSLASKLLTVVAVVWSHRGNLGASVEYVRMEGGWDICKLVAQRVSDNFEVLWGQPKWALQVGESPERNVGIIGMCAEKGRVGSGDSCSRS